MPASKNVELRIAALPANQKLRHLLNLGPSSATPALSSTLEVMALDPIGQLVWGQVFGVTTRPASNFHVGHIRWKQEVLGLSVHLLSLVDADCGCSGPS